MSPARRTTNSPRRRDERGAVSLELAIMFPFLLGLIALVIVAGRVALAGNSVEQAADEAARSASISRTAGGARAAAVAGARAVLDRQGLECSRISVVVDVAGFAVPVGQPAEVRASVTCVVRLSDVALPGWPGSKTVTATAVSPLDVYRDRSLGFVNSEGSPAANPRVGAAW